MINAIAVDDETLALQVIETFCAKTEFINLQKTFTHPTEALKHLRKFPADLLFLDINMPSISGIELYNSLEQTTMVIFTTAYSEFAVEGFNLNAVDYLLKPFTFDRFLQAVNKVKQQSESLRQTESAQESYLMIRADYALQKIAMSEIMLIEGLDDYIKIHLNNGKNIVARMTMKNILEKLPARDFVRVHRSFIVPAAKIEWLQKKLLRVAGRDIPVGSSYAEELVKRFDRQGSRSGE